MTGSQRIENDLGKVDSVYSFMTCLINDANEDIEKYCSPKMAKSIRKEFDTVCTTYKHAIYKVEMILDEGGWADV